MIYTTRFMKRSRVPSDERRGSRCNRFVSCGAGILLALLLVTSTMKAQNPDCPNDITPTNVGWNGPKTAHIFVVCNGKTCTITSIYCDRTVTNGTGQSTYETYLYSVTKDPGLYGDCSCIDGEVMIEWGMKATFNAIGNGAPGCSTPDRILWNGYRAPCFQRKAGGGFGPCESGTGSYCVETCQLCYSTTLPPGTPPGYVYSSDCSWQTIGTPACLNYPPVPWGSSDTTCYLLHCGT